MRGTKGKGKKSSRDEVFEDLDVDVGEVDYDEGRIVHNKRKLHRTEETAVVPKDAHRFADEDEDYEEEERLAQEMMKTHRSRVEEDDFAIGGVSSKIAAKSKAKATSSSSKTPKVSEHQTAMESVARDFNALSSDERMEFLKRESPELLAMLQEVKGYLSEVKSVSEPLHHALHNLRKTPEQKQVLSFLETKMQLMLSYCMHVTFYLMLKTEGKQVKNHPVLDRLVELRVYLEKLWPLEEKLQYTLNKLLSSSEGAAIKVANLRAVKSEDAGVYQAVRGAGFTDEGKQRRKDRIAAQEAEKLQKEEESLMTRFQAKKSSVPFDKVRPADEGYHEDADQFFTKLVEDDDAAPGESLIERLRARQVSKVTEPKAPTHKSAKATPSPESEDGDDLDEDGDLLSDMGSDDYEALVTEQHERDEHKERVKDMKPTAPTAKEVDRRKIGSRIESHRGLTKARPKDRKTPRTAQRRKFERGMQKVKSQVKSVAPEPEDGFAGVRALRPNVTHSTRFQK